MSAHCGVILEHLHALGITAPAHGSIDYTRRCLALQTAAIAVSSWLAILTCVHVSACVVRAVHARLCRKRDVRPSRCVPPTARVAALDVARPASRQPSAPSTPAMRCQVCCRAGAFVRLPCDHAACSVCVVNDGWQVVAAEGTTVTCPQCATPAFVKGAGGYGAEVFVDGVALQVSLDMAVKDLLLRVRVPVASYLASADGSVTLSATAGEATLRGRGVRHGARLATYS